ncbi:T9SS type A sorting domain-containing protein, partial [bacterium]|nr:T9SS type A sorting domain-containing protein [bacterium]
AVPLSDVVPEGYSLAQNYPNPFNAVTELSYAIANAGHVRLAIYNVTGRLVATLVNEEQGAGEYQVTFDAGDLPSGVYIYRLEAGTFVSQHKMVLLK